MIEYPLEDWEKIGEFESACGFEQQHPEFKKFTEQAFKDEITISDTYDYFNKLLEDGWSDQEYIEETLKQHPDTYWLTLVDDGRDGYFELYKKCVIKKPRCPHCGETSNYSREDINPADNEIIVTCECYNCDKRFTETFEYVESDKI